MVRQFDLMSTTMVGPVQTSVEVQMTDEDIVEFGDLWSLNARDNYYLICVSDEGVVLERCVIYSKITQTAKSISDDKLADEVKKRMFDAGVPIVRWTDVLV